MRRRAFAALVSLFALVAASRWGLAAEEAEPGKKPDPGAKVTQKKPVDEYRSVIMKLTAARKRAIQNTPELKAIFDEIQAKQKELKKQLDELYAKVSAASPTVAELEKKKAELDAERKKKREAERAARRAKREKKPRKRKKAD